MAGMSASLQSNAAMEQEPEGGLEVLEADLAELENSVFHLVRSNVELAQVLLLLLYSNYCCIYRLYWLMCLSTAGEKAGLVYICVASPRLDSARRVIKKNVQRVFLGSPDCYCACPTSAASMVLNLWWWPGNPFDMHLLRSYYYSLLCRRTCTAAAGLHLPYSRHQVSMLCINVMYQ